MKKLIATFLTFAFLAIAIPFTATTANAQRYQRPNFYKRHRNVINIGIASGAGAIIGGLLGGKKGALIGAGVGAGSGALYTYKINPKTGRYYRVRRGY